MLRMAHRLTSHHRALFSPKYLSGTSAHITTTSYFRAPFDVKDKDDFQKKVLASVKPVLVDFHANWCGPCKALSPKLDAIMGEKDGLLELAKVDIDVHSDLAMEYEVAGIPTVLGVKNGKVVNRFTGLIETKELREFVEKLLS
ncbi:thioredoxin, mitochondrial-like [Stylophora pistillata]|uniref:thioredoxin, mitochondrial-like n=1 Tax=Stylophora pistillata TaxID=50429 RepID=UPI000C03A92E|nr:thioredoxin, mitochondrial-like [Stylophora pistillata]